MSYFRKLFISRVVERDMDHIYYQNLLGIILQQQEEIISSTFLYKKNIQQKNRCYFVQGSNVLREQNVCVDLHDYVEQLQRTMSDNIYKLDIHCFERHGDDCKHNYNVVESTVIEFEKIYLVDILKQTYLYKINCTDIILKQIYEKLFMYMDLYNMSSIYADNDICVSELINNINMWLFQSFENINSQIIPLLDYYFTYVPRTNIIDIPGIINKYEPKHDIAMKFVDVYIDNLLNENTKIVHKVSIK